jgi:hypothetical protein
VAGALEKWRPVIALCFPSGLAGSCSRARSPDRITGSGNLARRDPAVSIIVIVVIVIVAVLLLRRIF